MKILLINPPLDNIIASGTIKLLENETGNYPPLGLLYIASYIKHNSNHEIKIIDSPAENMTAMDIKKEIEMYQPDLVGITCMSFTLLDVVSILRIVKEISKDIKVVLGGPHARIFPVETLNLVGVDFVIPDEGEIPFKELMDSLEQGRDLEQVRGILFKRNEIPIITDRPLPIDIDKLPFPDRTLIDYKKYYSLVGRHSLATTIIASRGCPYNCFFCSNPRVNYRLRSPKKVVDEIEECLDLGISEFYFYDDTFNANRKYVLEICKEMINRSLKIIWTFRGTIKPIDLEMLERLKEAGCYRIQFGVESGNQDILNLMNKQITLGEIKKTFSLTKKVRISTMAYFIIGYIGETKQHIIRTIQFAKELNSDLTVFSIFVPYPGTEVYNRALINKEIETDYWKEFAIQPNSAFLPPYWEKKLTRSELKYLSKLAFKKVYFRIDFFLSNLLKIKSFTELKFKIAGLIKMIRDILL